MNFHSALSVSNKLPVYSTDCISRLIKFKWDKFWYIALFQAFIYLLAVISILFGLEIDTGSLSTHVFI